MMQATFINNTHLNLIAVIATWSTNNTTFVNGVITLFWKINIIINITAIIFTSLFEAIIFALLIDSIPVESSHILVGTLLLQALFELLFFNLFLLSFYILIFNEFNHDLEST